MLDLFISLNLYKQYVIEKLINAKYLSLTYTVSRYSDPQLQGVKTKHMHKITWGEMIY